MDNIMNGTSKGYSRSQDEPRYNDGAVKILTTHTLDDFLETDNTGKFVLFWKKNSASSTMIDAYQRPVYWQIAEESVEAGLAGPGKVQFAEFDNTENENPNFLSDLELELMYFSEDLSSVQKYSLTGGDKNLNRETYLAWMNSMSSIMNGTVKSYIG